MFYLHIHEQFCDVFVVLLDSTTILFLSSAKVEMSSHKKLNITILMKRISQ